MKKIILLFGIMMALVVCITPVAAVSADDFEIVTKKDGKLNTYTYSNVNNPDEGYTRITTDSTRYSYVTFKPANIPDAPVMVVDTDRPADIYLTRIDDEWEIKYYSSSGPISQPNDKYLKNAGVVNLNEISRKYISKEFELVQGKYIMCPDPKHRILIYTIPDALTSEAFKVENEEEEGDFYPTYKYCNMNNPDEKYIEIFVDVTRWLHSRVTFKAANIEGAPVMVVDTGEYAYAYLPRSVDEWEIKYYSKFGDIPPLTDEYLKNAGVVNLKEFFGKYIEKRLVLERSQGQYIRPGNRWEPKYRIPDVD